MTRPNPWDRQPGESDPAWAAFVVYRDMGLDRSTAKVRENVGKSQRLIEGWSSRHSWVMRVQAWDADQDRQWQKTLRRKQREAIDRNLAVANATMGAVSNRIMQLVNDSSKMKPAEAAALMNSALRLQEFAFTAVGVPAPGNGEAGGFDAETLEDLTDEEIRLHMQALKRELESDLADYGGEDLDV